MPAYDTDDIRNVALLGHGGAGKTLLAEAIAGLTGNIPAAASSGRGTTLSDHEPEERTHQHSMFTSVLSLDHAGLRLNLLDTPGYPDFLGRALGALAAVETAAVVVDARTGVQPTTRRVMQAAAERGLARLLVVNRIDAEDLEHGELLAQLQTEFGEQCLPINLPAAQAAAVVDCFFSPGHGVATAFSSVEAAHTCIVDQVVEMDELLMELYLEQGEAMPPERLHDAFESALRAGHLVPVCYTSAVSGAGVGELLRIVERLMPSPREANPPPYGNGGSESAAVLPDAAAPLVGHVFKVSIDPFVGRLAAFRVFQGRVCADTQLRVGAQRRPARVGHLFRLLGKHTEEVSEAIPGDICAVGKIEELGYGELLHDSEAVEDLCLRDVPLPEPMFGLAIEAASRGDEHKLADALHKLAAEDPSLRVSHDEATGETVLHGLGELHLRMALERMQARHHLVVHTHAPRIAYRETISIASEAQYRHRKQTGGAGQFGEVHLRIEPLARGEGFEFVDAVVGGAIPSALIPAVEKGVRQAMAAGAVAGYPMQDLRVTVFDGKHHSVDSKEVAFITAGRRAFLEAVARARPVLLEPIVQLRVSVPQDHVGGVTGDLASRRGRINGTTAEAGGVVCISGQAPLSELEDYPSLLTSMTAGAGVFSMETSHYEAVPAALQQRLIAAFSPIQDEC